MGRQAKLKARRRAERQRTAAFSVVCPGVLEVLSVGKGDLRIAIGDSNADRAKAQSLIEEMLRKGYTLFVETDDGPLRVTKFDPDKMAYTVADTPDVVADSPGPAARPRAGRRTHSPGAVDQGAGPGESEAEPEVTMKRRGKRTVPVAGSRATAIGRTAGG